jgi:hypothetical protein
LTNKAMHTEPPIAQFSNGELRCGGPVIAVDYEVLSLASDGRHCLMIFCLGQHFSWSVS